MAFIRFLTVPNFAETGSAGVGWTYTGSSANATANDPDYSLPSGVAGGMVVKADATGGALPKLGFATTPDSAFFAGWTMEMVGVGGVWQWSSAGATLTTDVAQSYVAGDLVRFTFDASNGFTVEIARAAAPTTWLPYRAGTHTRSATWYPKLVSDSAAGAVFTTPQTLEPAGGPDVTGSLPPVTLAAPTAYAATAFEWPEPVTLGWIRQRPASGFEVWHSAPGRSILEHYYFGVEASGSTNATGALPAVTLSAPDAAATGGGAAAGSVDAVDLSAPQAGAAGGAAASGGFDSVDLTAPQASATSGAAASGGLDVVDLAAPQASATGGGAATGAVAGVSLTAPQGAANSGATASGALSAITLAAPQGAANGGAAAAGAVDAVDLSAPQASATGGAAASGLFDSVDLVAPQASAASAGPGAAVGAIAPVSLSPAQAAATGAASVSGVLPAVTLTAPQALAGSGAVATGAMASVSLTAAQATAAGGAVAAGPMVGINLAPAEAAALGAAWVAAELAQIALTAPQGTATEGFVPEYTDLPAGSGHTRNMTSAARPAVTSAAARPGHTATQRPAR